MSESWINTILLQLPQQTEIFELPFDSVFEGVFLPQKRLAIHFITIDPQRILKLPDNYFKDLSDKADNMSIQCIHIWEDVFMQNPELVIERIKAIIGIRKRFHARETEIVRMDKHQMDQFLNIHHLQKSVSGYYKYGLFLHNECVAMASFSKARIMNDGIVPYRSYEWIRYASLTGVTVIGGLGKLFSHFVIEKQPAHLMTYVDRDWGRGDGYLKLGFGLKETTEPIPFYIHLKEKRRILNFSPSQDDLDHNRYIKCYNAGSLKFVWFRNAK